MRIQADGIERPSFVSRSLSLIDAAGNLEEQENVIRDTAGMVYTGTCSPRATLSGIP